MDKQHQQQTNPGLMRYLSAPSSYFASVMNSGEENFDQFLKSRPYSPDTRRTFSRFASGGGREDSSSHNLREFDKSSMENEGLQSQLAASMKHQSEDFQNRQLQQGNNAYSCASSEVVYLSKSQQSLLNQNTAASSSAMEDSIRVVSSMAMDRGFPQMNIGGGGGGPGGRSNLIRQSSSPAGFLSYFNAGNDYSVMGGMGNSGPGEGDNAEASIFSGRLRVQIDFSPGPPSSSGRMAPIPETTTSMGMDGPEGESFHEDPRSPGGYIPSFRIDSWDDSVNLSGPFLEGLEDDDINPEAGLNATENQEDEGGKRPSTILSHHLSLPQSAMDKLLHFQDSVPFKTRAKRGCATHPRSVAERVRRTRISERIRKLQELVPNMDKQTNTSDMLDLAVDYIKDLQREVKTLSEIRAKCTCTNKQNQ